MEFKYELITREDSSRIRQRFIDLFIDVENDFYVKYILPLKANDVWYGYGHCVSYLWSCLKKEYCNSAEFSVIKEYLKSLGDKEIYLMFDIRPKQHIYPDECKTLKEPYTKLFPSDTVVKMSADEALKVIINDMNATAYEQLFFGDDIYTFDESFQWFFATTHNYFLDENGFDTDKRICYGNIHFTDSGKFKDD